MMLAQQTRLLRGVSALLLIASWLLVVPIAVADEPANTGGFRKAVTLEGVRAHQAALQAIADANGGNRLSGTAGFDASAQYVFDTLTAAGYSPSYQEFTFLLNADRTPAVLQRTAPTAKTYIDGVDFQSMSYSGNGDVTAAVVAVDILIHSMPGTLSTSGCEAADFAGFPAGAIALVQRGTCSFRQKADNAGAAGAAGAIVFNEGNSADRMGMVNGRLNPPETVTGIPVVGATFALGDELRNGVLNGPTGTEARLRVDRVNETRTTRNVIAETPGGDPNQVVVVGAHLDSVPRGPGINDNGSGAATILEVAEVFAAQERAPRNKIRFMWYGAEEFGLIGSRYYVDQLPQAELDKIALMLNFDMIGSPNFVRFVYDGDNSAFPAPPGGAAQPGPAGSGEIERVFRDYFTSQGLASEPTPFNGRSDYGPFIAKGIPAGGLFTGAEGIKTAAQAAIYGGTAGAPYDPCYHLACDTYANNNDTVLDQNADAVAHTVLYFSKRNFDKDPLVNPVVTPDTGTGGGGGLHDGHDHEEADR
ncbi:MAG: M28 family metallopeptidase [Chloroflexota bacterium]|nr:M28 family metallopeptidase [Chloroflexota bacterium]